MEMNCGTANQWQGARWTILALAGAWLLIPSLSAGEPIQFTREKANTSPGTPTAAQLRLDKEKGSALDRDPSASPYRAMSEQGFYSGEALRGRDPKEEKRRKLAELERKNWMRVEKGELQEKEDEKTSFGVRDYDDSLENDQTEADLWFGPPQDKGANTPGRPRAPGSYSRGQGPNRAVPRADDDEKSGNLSVEKSSLARKGEPVTGAHTSKELNLRNLAAPDQTDVTLKGLLGGDFRSGSSLDGRGRRRDDFGLRAPDAQLGAGSSISMFGKGIGFGRELGPTPTALSGSTLLDTSSRSQLPGSPGSGPGFGLSGDSLNSSANSFSGPRGFETAPTASPQSQNDPWARSVQGLSPLSARPGAFSTR